MVDANNIAGFMLTQKLGKIPGIKGTHANPNSYRNGQGLAKGLKKLIGEVDEPGEGTVLRNSNNEEVIQSIEVSQMNIHRNPKVRQELPRVDSLVILMQKGPYRIYQPIDTIIVPSGTIPEETPNGNNSKYRIL